MTVQSTLEKAKQLIPQDQNLQPSYYKRTFEIPTFITEVSADLAEVTPAALHFVGLLYPQAGKALSLGSATIELLSHKSIWSFLKAGAEITGTLSGLRNGMVIHTAMNLAESFWAFRHIRQMEGSQVAQKMAPVVSRGLYLITLLAVSKKIQYTAISASLVFRAAISAYNAYAMSTKRKGDRFVQSLKAGAYSVLTALYLVKAYRSIQELHQQMATVEHVFTRKVPLKLYQKPDETEVPSARYRAIPQPKADEIQEDAPTPGGIVHLKRFKAIPQPAVEEIQEDAQTTEDVFPSKRYRAIPQPTADEIQEDAPTPGGIVYVDIRSRGGQTPPPAIL